MKTTIDIDNLSKHQRWTNTIQVTYVEVSQPSIAQALLGDNVRVQQESMAPPQIINGRPRRAYTVSQLQPEIWCTGMLQKW